ncbi:MAG: tRNA uridine-5-carboxymethylaminomethyl(34) synthesis GTPase MnmE [Myxococcaceae bacterium]
MSTSTIAAIATGPARGGIGVIRLSGPSSLRAARKLAAALPSAPEPRHAYLVQLGAESMLDEGLALYFPAPHSVTGEDVVELHAHGSPRLLSLLLSKLLEGGEVRLAEAGEFTRRAFLNGRIDLARAEAVADLVAADSERAVRAAASQLAGGLSERVRAVRAPLLELHADLEAALDFPDEAEESELDLPRRVGEQLAAVTSLAEATRRGAVVRRGARVVLHGPANAGKSTLFNALVGEDRALVDAEPGTTRDALEAKLEWNGLAVTLVDTAGLREPGSRVEAMGIERTVAAVKGADLAVRLVLAGEPLPQVDAGVLVVSSKSDLSPAPAGALAVSGLTGAGIDALRSAILERLALAALDVVLTSERHLDSFERAQQALLRAEQAVKAATLEVVAGEVGLAVAALGEVTGENAAQDLIDAIFRRFCIGK